MPEVAAYDPGAAAAVASKVDNAFPNNIMMGSGNQNENADMMNIFKAQVLMQMYQQHQSQILALAAASAALPEQQQQQQLGVAAAATLADPLYPALHNRTTAAEGQSSVQEENSNLSLGALSGLGSFYDKSTLPEDGGVQLKEEYEGEGPPAMDGDAEAIQKERDTRVVTGI